MLLEAIIQHTSVGLNISNALHVKFKCGCMFTIIFSAREVVFVSIDWFACVHDYSKLPHQLKCVSFSNLFFETVCLCSSQLDLGTQIQKFVFTFLKVHTHTEIAQCCFQEFHRKNV